MDSMDIGTESFNYWLKRLQTDETPRPTISSTFYPGEGWGRIRITTSRRILERDFSNEKDQNQIWDLISKKDINEAELSKLGFRESNESISR